ncbi:hypothetical protein DAH66_21920 [Sphingomonas koreensis]|jgi:hypothetical protein|uniref:Uncharacterized protein n=1 Tax=Sphingomonas koreensis TaxID=93064 RepID=A0A430FXI5_9SPHN|nr:hypothetical protein [Sphingomonas koreensis]RSY76326.1 hypothetical protein DAH66_21920 [Sphingomonas koreensis]
MTILVNETLETVSAMVPCVMPAACAQRASIVAAEERREQFDLTTIYVPHGETYFSAVTDLSLVDAAEIQKYLGCSPATGCVIAVATADEGRPVPFGIAIRRRKRFKLEYGYFLVTPRGRDGVFMSNDARLPCYRLRGGKLAEVPRPIRADFD